MQELFSFLPLFLKIGPFAAALDFQDPPYALPISYAYDGDRLIFHSAVAGHKLDAIAREPKASFCVIDQDRVVSAEYTTYYRSVIAFGKMRLLDGEEKRSAAMLLAERYAPGETVQRHTEVIDES